MKNSLIENKIKEDKIVQYHIGQAFFRSVDPKLDVFLMFLPGWLVDPYVPEVAYRKTFNLYGKFQFM